MNLRLYALGIFALVAVPGPVQAQTTEERLAELEQLVQELRALHDLPVDAVELPVELVGNEHVRWGYPGGTCAFLIKEHYVTCHNDETLVPDWVTYHMTRENLDGDAVREKQLPTRSGTATGPARLTSRLPKQRLRSRAHGAGRRIQTQGDSHV